MSIGENVILIEEIDWSNLISDIYNRPYCFQQQEGCRSKGIFYLDIPNTSEIDEESLPTSIAEEINGEEMCVQFKSWLNHDPKQGFGNITKDQEKNLFWERNFYPSIYTVANDLYEKGILKAGKYIINIDW